MLKSLIVKNLSHSGRRLINGTNQILIEEDTFEEYLLDGEYTVIDQDPTYLYVIQTSMTRKRKWRVRKTNQDNFSITI